MSEHEHYWEASAIPGYTICSCGSSRHYDRYKKVYCIHPDYFLFEGNDDKECM